VASLFCTNQPCFDMREMIVNAGIIGIYYRSGFRMNWRGHARGSRHPHDSGQRIRAEEHRGSNQTIVWAKERGHEMSVLPRD